MFLVIPVHNRVSLQRTCLGALDRQTMHRGFAVVVVDDGSSDGTGDTLVKESPSVKHLRGDGPCGGPER